MTHWTLDDIAWDRFEADKVDPQILKVMKAASVVEHNGGDYATYLCNVFHDDPEFQEQARIWAAEEVQHGRALGRWAETADPGFDFDAAFDRFIAGFRPDVEAQESIRGSRSGELVARCIVEVGTSSYYAAMSEACKEPVLKEVCGRIAADELRHYRLFYKALKRYLDREGIGRFRRILVALGRIRESEDDELAYAYHATNAGPDDSYDRKRASDIVHGVAFRYYQPKHVDRVVAMTAKAAGLNPQGIWVPWVSALALRLIRRRGARLETAQAA